MFLKFRMSTFFIFIFLINSVVGTVTVVLLVSNNLYAYGGR